MVNRAQTGQRRCMRPVPCDPQPYLRVLANLQFALSKLLLRQDIDLEDLTTYVVQYEAWRGDRSPFHQFAPDWAQKALGDFLEGTVMLAHELDILRIPHNMLPLPLCPSGNSSSFSTLIGDHVRYLFCVLRPMHPQLVSLLSDTSRTSLADATEENNTFVRAMEEAVVKTMAPGNRR